MPPPAPTWAVAVASWLVSGPLCPTMMNFPHGSQREPFKTYHILPLQQVFQCVGRVNPLLVLLPRRRWLPREAQRLRAGGCFVSSGARGAAAGAEAASRAAAPHSLERETARGGEGREGAERKEEEGGWGAGESLPHRPRRQQRHRPGGEGGRAARGGGSAAGAGRPPAGFAPTANSQAGGRRLLSFSTVNSPNNVSAKKRKHMQLK